MTERIPFTGDRDLHARLHKPENRRLSTVIVAAVASGLLGLFVYLTIGML